MIHDRLRNLLDALMAGQVDRAQVLSTLLHDELMVDGMHQATVDTHRELRTGVPEVIFGLGKTAEQLLTIMQRLNAAGLEVGIRAADQAYAQGYRCLVMGEVGIGNTTPAAALISVFTGADVATVTGRGAGADDETLARKIGAIRKGIEVNAATPERPVAALAGVGGLEHAAMAGFVLGGAAHRLPVIVDGVIACSAALVADGLAPAASGYLIGGHNGVEAGIAVALRHLRLDPVVALDLRLGEGSGAVSVLPIVRGAAAILSEMATFDSAGVSGRE